MFIFNFSSKASCCISFISRRQLGVKNYQKLCTSNLENISILPNEVLSQANREKCLKLFSSIKEIKPFSSKNLKTAAVLVPISKIDDKLALLYTERALHLKVNGGEIAFPGGMFDESDRTLEKTALREAYEEVGLMPNEIDVWGKGPEIHRSDVKVTPFLAYIGKLELHKLKPNVNEVASVFTVSLEDLTSSTNFKVTRFRSGKTSIFVMPVYLGGQKRIWGLTAYITHLVLSSLIPDIYKKNITFHPSIQKVVHYKEKFNIINEIKK